MSGKSLKRSKLNSKPNLYTKIKTAWYNMPKWKRWLFGASVILSTLAFIGCVLAVFVFTGGLSAAILAGVVAGLSIGASVSGAICNAHSAYDSFRQGKILKGTFALIGCLSSVLGAIGTMFWALNLFNTEIIIGLSAGSIGGRTISGAGGLVAGCVSDDQPNCAVLKVGHPETFDSINPSKENNPDGSFSSTHNIIQNLKELDSHIGASSSESKKQNNGSITKTNLAKRANYPKLSWCSQTVACQDLKKCSFNRLLAS